MRMLALTDYQVDYLADGILCGLYESGHDIYEMPILGHVRGKADEGYILPDGSIGYTAVPGYLKRNPLPENPHKEEEIFDLVSSNQFDLICLLSYRKYAIEALKVISSRSGKHPKDMPLVVLDGEDHPIINVRLIDEIKPKVYFKRELYKETGRPPSHHGISCPVWPLPFAAFTRSYPEVDDENKELDLFLALGHTYEARNALLGKFLEASKATNARSYIAGNDDNPIRSTHRLGKELKRMLAWEDYIRMQAKSKITASMRGFGRDALHAWEALSFSTLTLYCDPGLFMPHPYIDGEHVVKFSEDCSEVPDLIKTYLNEEDERKKIARSGKEWTLRHHTTKARAEYMIEVSLSTIRGERIDTEKFGI